MLRQVGDYPLFGLPKYMDFAAVLTQIGVLPAIG